MLEDDYYLEKEINEKIQKKQDIDKEYEIKLILEKNTIVIFIICIVILNFLIIYFYDNLFYFISNKYLETITPNCFIPNLVNQNLQQVSVLLGFVTFVSFFIIAIWGFIWRLKFEKFYNGEFPTHLPNSTAVFNDIWLILEKGGFDRKLTLWRYLVLFHFPYIMFGFVFPNTFLLKFEIWEICLAYFIFPFWHWGFGMMWAEFIYRTFYK